MHRVWFREENPFYRIWNGPLFPEISVKIRTPPRKQLVGIYQLCEKAAPPSYVSVWYHMGLVWYSPPKCGWGCDVIGGKSCSFPTERISTVQPFFPNTAKWHHLLPISREILIRFRFGRNFSLKRALCDLWVMNFHRTIPLILCNKAFQFMQKNASASTTFSSAILTEKSFCGSPSLYWMQFQWCCHLIRKNCIK